MLKVSPFCAIISLVAIMTTPSASTAISFVDSELENISNQKVDIGYIHTWRTIQRRASSGHLTKLNNFVFNCDEEAKPSVSAIAKHGTTTTKENVTKACGRTRPVTELWYQSEAGFHGIDEVTVGPPFYVSIEVTVQ